MNKNKFLKTVLNSSLLLGVIFIGSIGAEASEENPFMRGKIKGKRPPYKAVCSDMHEEHRSWKGIESITGNKENFPIEKESQNLEIIQIAPHDSQKEKKPNIEIICIENQKGKHSDFLKQIIQSSGWKGEIKGVSPSQLKLLEEQKDKKKILNWSGGLGDISAFFDPENASKKYERDYGQYIPKSMLLVQSLGNDRAWPENTLTDLGFGQHPDSILVGSVCETNALAYFSMCPFHYKDSDYINKGIQEISSDIKVLEEESEEERVSLNADCFKKENEETVLLPKEFLDKDKFLQEQHERFKKIDILDVIYTLGSFSYEDEIGKRPIEGTSGSAPYVSATLAQTWQSFPQLKAQDIKAIGINSALKNFFIPFFHVDENKGPSFFRHEGKKSTSFYCVDQDGDPFYEKNRIVFNIGKFQIPLACSLKDADPNGRGLLTLDLPQEEIDVLNEGKTLKEAYLAGHPVLYRKFQKDLYGHGIFNPKRANLYAEISSQNPSWDKDRILEELDTRDYENTPEALIKKHKNNLAD